MCRDARTMKLGFELSSFNYDHQVRKHAPDVLMLGGAARISSGGRVAKNRIYRQYPTCERVCNLIDKVRAQHETDKTGQKPMISIKSCDPQVKNRLSNNCGCTSVLVTRAQDTIITG